jgi:UDP-MurNAc hydroxylase
MKSGHSEARKNGITVRYIYSACIVTSTPDVRILHDPWFTDGVYHGSWFQFPKLSDPIQAIGDVDAIWISHVHPDHYDALFLKKYFEVYGKKEILIADHVPNHLANKMRAEGLACTVLSAARTIGSTTVELIPHATGHSSDLDSAIIVKYDDGAREHCVVNANDIIFDADILGKIRFHAPAIDILLCGYTGAGPYPQTYFSADHPELGGAAERKKLSFFERYKKTTQALGAKVNIPFAGKYILGGKLSTLNAHRGVADAVEILALDPHAVVLADGGGEIDTVALSPNAVRTQPYSAEALNRRLREIGGLKLEYEKLVSEDQVHQLPLKRLLFQASRRAVEKSEFSDDYLFVVPLPNGERAVINANRAAATPMRIAGPDEALPEPRSELSIDPRLLFGLLTYVYHWNNAEVGSLYMTRRYPDVFQRQVQAFLNNLTL